MDDEQQQVHDALQHIGARTAERSALTNSVRMSSTV
jgi:hypothetical protein